MRIPTLLRIMAGALLLWGCERAPAGAVAPTPNADPLHAAVEQLTSVIVNDIFSPPQASRVDTYASIAAYEAMDEELRRGIAAPVIERSTAYGERVAQHVLGWAANDRFKQSRGYPKYSVSPTPGRWIPTEYTSGHSVISTAAAVVLSGIHYRRAIEQGVVQGRTVAELVLRRVQTRADAPRATNGGAR